MKSVHTDMACSYDTPVLTIARLAHIDLEGLVMDSKVRSPRDRFVTYEWSQCLYNGKLFLCGLFGYASVMLKFLARHVLQSGAGVSPTLPRVQPEAG